MHTLRTNNTMTDEKVIQDEVSSLIEGVKTLREERDAFEKECDEYKTKILYLKADIENVRKNSNKRIAEIQLTASKDTINAILPSLDDLERVEENLTDEDKNSHFGQGFNLALLKLRTALSKLGVSEVPMDKYDANYHEAISITSGKEGSIVHCVNKGYMLNGKVIRYAKVIVGG